MAPVGNGMQFNRAQSFAPPKKVADVPMFKRAQSFTAALDITMSVDSLYNHAIRYLKKENNEELAEAAFKAALSRDPRKALLALDLFAKKSRNLPHKGCDHLLMTRACLSRPRRPFFTDPCLLLLCSKDHVSSLVGLGTLLKKIGREEEGTEMLHSATPSIPLSLSPSNQPSTSLSLHSSLFFLPLAHAHVATIRLYYRSSLACKPLANGMCACVLTVR
jgi:hypothetical protein